MSMYGSLTSVLDRAVDRSPPETAERPLARRVALVVAIAATAAVTAVVTAPFSAAGGMDTDLVRLLHAMVGIKGIIALAAAALVSWRFGHPIARPVAIGYGAAICVSAAALAWLWTLASIPLGSLCFYGGLAGLILVGRFDSGLSARLGR
ncbi:hypothetical protein ThimaDRAFT_0573 [Thiocapsa marina 5811]|uniref:Uncharacterized protein n=1 Tax=Thiocapsa marina 5811 TaxID=768671 RepID=F9U6M1_9GAMM|nr:hypothetical protein ThimaDRAFT_0573 [Thiocapsa marina 5811]